MHSIIELIDMALKEDIGPSDITTENLINPDQKSTGVIISKESLIIAGLEVAENVFHRLSSSITFKSDFKDGDPVPANRIVAEIKGNTRALLMGERVALNFLQRLSGIATHVHFFQTKLKDIKVRLVDTRKTTPGWRVLEKYAVRMGGAHNHRMGLYDGVLIKDNHIAASGGIKKAVHRIKEKVSHLVNIEVEATNLAQIKEALEVGVDVIMLDNMKLDQIRDAVEYIDGKAIVEVSGGVQISDLIELSQTGVDIISAGALTHSARCVDLSMKIN